MSEPPKTLPDFDRMWNYNDPAGTEQTFRALLPQAKQSGDRAYLAQLLTQIARTQGLQQKFDDAHATLDEVEAMLAAEPAGPLSRLRYLLERGRVFNSSGDARRARPLFERVFEMAPSNNLDACAIDAAHMIAIVETDPALQLEWNIRALKIAEKSGDERARRWRASLYNNIGWTHFNAKQFTRALDIFQKAVALRAEMNQPREHHIARYCVAKTLRHMRRIDDALAINRALLEEAKAAGTADGYVLEEIAECLMSQRKPDEAKPYFRQAFELLSKDAWLTSSEPARIQRLKQLGGGA